MDFTITLLLGVIGLFASFKGLKLSTVETILLAIEARNRMRLPRLFRVAVIRRASLWEVRFLPLALICRWISNLLFSCNKLSSRSKSPDASASRLAGGIRGWSRGTRAREISFLSVRYKLVRYSRFHCSSLKITYPWIGNHSRCLGLYNSLDKLDTAYAHTRRSSIHPSKDVWFDGCHGLPGCGVAGICNTTQNGPYEQFCPLKWYSRYNSSKYRACEYVVNHLMHFPLGMSNWIGQCTVQIGI